MHNNETPMTKQYKDIKSRNLDKILFFRVGDFYEMFYEDAILAAKELDITLTSREMGKGNKAPLAGVPYHAADNYVAKLLEKGYKVAICEQVEDPKKAKGLVKREIVRVITPGTMVEHALLKDKENNYLLSLGVNKQRWGIAVADISTGELSVTEFSDSSSREKAFDEIKRIAPAECLFSEAFREAKYFDHHDGKTLVNYYPAAYFSYEKAAGRVLNHFNSPTLAGLGLTDYDGAVCALGALLEYLYENNSNVHYLKNINLYQRDNYLVIDSISRRNLELKASIRDGRKYGSLLWVLDKTVTAMGGRLLRKWIEQPLIDKRAIIKRQDMIEDLINSGPVRESLRESLKEVKDMERLISRINQGTGNARDLLSLKNSLKLMPAISKTLAISNNFKKILKGLFPLEKLVFELEEALKDDPPLTVKEGNMIRNGYNKELDNLRAEIRNSKSWLARLEGKEKERTGIKSLKIRYNKVFGYYIEITKTNLDSVPDDYIRKQTLVNCERFITQELKEKEEIILRADENIKEMEYEIFLELRRKTAAETEKIFSTAAAVAQIDCLLSLADVTVENRYVKPVISTEAEIMIEGGRHPVVEQVLDRGLFVDNDITLNKEQRMIILTGPNMAGKSTYLRQAALLTLMAQMGSYIPAKKAVIGIVDRIFTRVGATDDLVGGQSTFMVEMNEVANILKNATDKSLIILDEVGRGTSTYDGLSIAWATVEYICNQVRAKTLFATHYHELTALEEKYPVIKNFNIAVKERGDEVVFLRKVVPGGSDKSYGIQVASLAGLPVALIERARAILADIDNGSGKPKPMSTAASNEQLTLFNLDLAAREATSMLKKIDLLTITPLELVQKIYEIQNWLHEHERDDSHGRD